MQDVHAFVAFVGAGSIFLHCIVHHIQCARADNKMTKSLQQFVTLLFVVMMGDSMLFFILGCFFYMQMCYVKRNEQLWRQEV